MKTVRELQEFLGVTPDGDWGLKSQAALNAVIYGTEQASQEGSPKVWPKEADAASFYGHSDGSSEWEEKNLVLLPTPYPMYMDGMLVRNIRCHKKVAESLKRILLKIRELYPTNEQLHANGLDQYDGCYNYRSVRGATHLSMHAYGAAIDLDAADNPLGATHGKMPRDVVTLFKAEGWRWGGDYSGRKDWMHFEACS
jgi:hypothetical protein